MRPPVWLTGTTLRELFDELDTAWRALTKKGRPCGLTFLIRRWQRPGSDFVVRSPSLHADDLEPKLTSPRDRSPGTSHLPIDRLGDLLDPRFPLTLQHRSDLDELT